MSKSDLVAPQSGHIQVSGTSSHLVPGSISSSGHPFDSSYISPQTKQINLQAYIQYHQIIFIQMMIILKNVLL